MKLFGNILAFLLVGQALAIVYTWATIGLDPVIAWTSSAPGFVAGMLSGSVWWWHPWTQRGDS